MFNFESTSTVIGLLIVNEFGMSSIWVFAVCPTPVTVLPIAMIFYILYVFKTVAVSVPMPIRLPGTISAGIFDT